MRQAAHSNDNSLRCSFCGHGQQKVGKLISSPSDLQRAYICDECVAVCAAIIEDDKGEPKILHAKEMHERLPPHPLASDLMEAIERWIREQRLGNDGLLALAEMRRIATGMLSDSQREKNDATGR